EDSCGEEGIASPFAGGFPFGDRFTVARRGGLTLPGTHLFRHAKQQLAIARRSPRSLGKCLYFQLEPFAPVLSLHEPSPQGLQRGRGNHSSGRLHPLAATAIP